MLCDYKFGDDSAEEIRDHFLDMLDHSIQMEELEIAEETDTGNYLVISEPALTAWQLPRETFF